MKNLFSVVGKTAVVTGGSRGIGAMIARGFVENGVKTYITARKEEELFKTAKTLSQWGECIPFRCDLSTLQGISDFTHFLEKKEQQLNILVNNAGATWGAGIDEFPESAWDKVMDLNVKTPFFLTQKLLPLLQAGASNRDPARIINLSSMHGYINPKTDNYPYSTSKAAILHLTQHLAADLATRHINVNGIAPGLFPSKMTAHMIDGNEVEISTQIPRGRLGKMEDAAGTAIYLCSQASAWITGHTIQLDGGSVAAAG